MSELNSVEVTSNQDLATDPVPTNAALPETLKQEEMDYYKITTNEITATAVPTNAALSENLEQEEMDNDKITTNEITDTALTHETYISSRNEDTSIQPTPSTSIGNKQSSIEAKKDTRTAEEIKDELSELVTITEQDPRKRKRCKEEDSKDILLDVFLRCVYPLNDTMEKTITVGIFRSLNFKPAVLLSQCGKNSLLLTTEMWDRFTKYEPIIEAYLYNNLTGRKTTMGFDNSDIEIDSIRIRGTQFVRFRDLSKHNKKILLTFEEFHGLSNLIPAIVRYIQQLNTCYPIIFDYLNCSINTNPVLPLIYGPIDHSIYNRLPQEVSFYRKMELFFRRNQRDDSSAEPDHQKETTFENTNIEHISKDAVKTENATS